MNTLDKVFKEIADHAINDHERISDGGLAGILKVIEKQKEICAEYLLVPKESSEEKIQAMIKSFDYSKPENLHSDMCDLYIVMTST